MNRLKNLIPNCITSLTLGAGCLAIIAATYGTDELWGLPGYQWAFLFMAMGALADFLDGFAARLLKAYSDLGKELDSLCDLVTFGVAPALTLFFLMRDINVAPWLPWVTLLIPVCAAFRLARFNLDSRQTTNFIGLPVPANAIFWIGYASLLRNGVDFLGWWYVFLPFIVVECWLMNSNIPMFSLKMKTFGFRKNIHVYLALIAAAVFCFTLGTGGLFWLIVFYVLDSVAYRKSSQE